MSKSIIAMYFAASISTPVAATPEEPFKRFLTVFDHDGTIERTVTSSSSAVDCMTGTQAIGILNDAVHTALVHCVDENDEPAGTQVCDPERCVRIVPGQPSERWIRFERPG